MEDQIGSYSMELPGRKEERRTKNNERRARERLFLLILDATSDGVWDRNLRTGETYYGNNWARILGYTSTEIKRRNIKWEDLLHPDDKERALAVVREHIEGRTARYQSEFRLQCKDYSWKWIMARGKIVERDEDNKPLRFVGTHNDITDRKRAEEELQRFSGELEIIIKERTGDLGAANSNLRTEIKKRTQIEESLLKSEKELEAEKRGLEETNIALRVLLKRGEQDKKELEQNILLNIKQLIDPYLEKLHKSDLSEKQQSAVEMIQHNLNKITSSFIRNLSSLSLRLTPMEIKVANLVRYGKTSKEIAEKLNLSPETISIHRKNIRKKCGICNKKTNLRTILMSFDGQ